MPFTFTAKHCHLHIQLLHLVATLPARPLTLHIDMNNNVPEHPLTDGQSTNNFFVNDHNNTSRHYTHPLSQSGKGLYMMDNHHDHLHASYSVSNGQHLHDVDAKEESKSNNNNNGHEDIIPKSRRPKNLPNLDRLHTQNLTSLRPSTPSKGRGQRGEGHDNSTDKDYKHDHHQNHAQQHPLHQHLHPDDPIFNPDKKRPTTSALTTSICSTVEVADYKSFNGISKKIHQHFSRVDHVRSDEQLEKEKYLIGKIKFNRWIFLPAAFFFQGVCGTLYACKFFFAQKEKRLSRVFYFGVLLNAFFVL